MDMRTAMSWIGENWIAILICAAMAAMALALL